MRTRKVTCRKRSSGTNVENFRKIELSNSVEIYKEEIEISGSKGSTRSVDTRDDYSARRILPVSSKYNNYFTSEEH